MEEKRGQDLTAEEEKEFRDGSALREMVELNAGWQIVKGMLETLAFHSWVDPRTIDKPSGSSREEWEWQELNAFHAANNAKELLNEIENLISRAEYLGKKKSGEEKTRNFKI